MRAALFLCLAAPALTQTPADVLGLPSTGQRATVARQWTLQVAKHPARMRDPALESVLREIGVRLRAGGPFLVWDERRGSPPLPGDLAFPRVVARSGLVEPVALPDGAVILPLPMLGAIESEPELAAMLAHATAHTELRHADKMAEREQIFGVWADASTHSPEWNCRPNLNVFAREFEMEADRAAAEKLARAGYDPSALAAWIRSSGADSDDARPPAGARVAALRRASETLPPSVNEPVPGWEAFRRRVREYLDGPVSPR
ncbi:MAG: M48 family metalloprotease [Bryobacteraceae bacterium]